MALFQAYIPGAAKPFTEVAPSTTVGDHDSDGTDVTITATAHGLAVNMPIRLAGWTWADGGGDVNEDYVVRTVPSANTFIVRPAGTAPTNLTNPSVVGTYELLPHPAGAKLPVIAGEGLKINLPVGYWSIWNTSYAAAGTANAVNLGWRRTTSAADVTLPTSDYAVNTIEKQKNPLIEVGSDEVIGIRGGGSQGAPAGLIFDVPSGDTTIMIRPNERGVRA